VKQRVTGRPPQDCGWWSVATGLAGGLCLDLLLGDPRRGHPVAAFGTLAGRAERAAYRDSRTAGALYTGGLTAVAVTGGAVLSRTRAPALQRAAVTAAVTWTVVGATSLRREAAAMTALLARDDLGAARSRLSHLCGRDATSLDAPGLARATVESVAENTSDAVVGPLVWGAVFGVPGLLGYRAINTLDAMVGHRSERYLRFGWAAARADDVANLLPARITAGLAALLAPLVGGRTADAWRIWRRDGGRHPSPNAGRVEAAFAGALGRQLGGPLTYAGRQDDRPRLGDGPAPGTADIARAARLSGAVTAAAGGLAVAGRVAVSRRRR
jgi:adenosylcobinamide-phosphate synthase